MPKVDQIDCGLVLRVAGGKPRRLVVEVELGEAGNDAGDEFGGGQSSGELGPVARRHSRGRRGVLRPPGGALSTVTRSAAAIGDDGHGGGMASGAKLSGSTEPAVRGRKRQGKRGE